MVDAGSGISTDCGWRGRLACPVRKSSGGPQRRSWSMREYAVDDPWHAGCQRTWRYFSASSASQVQGGYRRGGRDIEATSGFGDRGRVDGPESLSVERLILALSPPKIGTGSAVCGHFHDSLTRPDEHHCGWGCPGQAGCQGQGRLATNHPLFRKQCDQQPGRLQAGDRWLRLQVCPRLTRHTLNATEQASSIRRCCPARASIR